MTKKESKNKNLKLQKSYFGWTVKRIENIKNDSMIFYELEHNETGARYVHLEADDKNNAFAVTFKTKPEDSTGVAHILEHTVLTGSEKYPVRDPFFSMLKRSLQTFMNAFTSEDWTAYPFSTQNKKDFYNLLSVYLDASFFPKISELSFRQEGWRYDFEGKRLVHKGVVFNEMKGVMSSPDRIMAEAIKQSLFDKSSYRVNSGGEPVKIVNLAYEDLKAFHKKFYHPSNAWFFSYGNLPLKKTLEQVSINVLSRFKREEQNNEFILEPRRQEENKLTIEFPVDREEEASKKYQTCVNWLICPGEDTYRVMSANLLFDILIGNTAAPLRHSLIESGLGNDMSDNTGYDSELRDTLFSVGLKEIKKGDVSKVKNLIYETLEGIKEKGIEEDLVKAAMHKLEISRKDISNLPYPHGLNVWLDMITPWIHSCDPLTLIEQEKNIAKLKKEIKKGRFFENLIDEYLLKNKHCSQVILKPSKELQEELIKKENFQLDQARKSLSNKEIKEIKDLAKNLEILQSSKEELNVLPIIELEDIDKTVEKLEKSKRISENFVKYRVDTNGLFYFSCLFDVKGIEKKEENYLPLLCYLFSRMGTKKRGYKDLANYLEINTGGINFSTPITSNKATGDLVSPFVVKGKSLEVNKTKLLEIFEEIILQTDFSNSSLLKRFLLEKIAGIESQVISSGHTYAITRAESSLGEVAETNERLHGISQLDFLKELAKDLSLENLKALSLRLEKIAKSFISSNKVKFVIFSYKEDDKVDNYVKEILSNFPKVNFIEKDKQVFSSKNLKETKEVPSAVSFVAASIKIPEINIEQKATFFVLAKMLARGFLHNEIREKGGAYGGFAEFSIFENIFSFGSYRDPNVENTLKTYARARDYILDLSISKEMMTEAIIMSISKLDKAKTKTEKAQSDYFDEYAGYDIEIKQNFRDAIFRVNPAKIKKVVKNYLPGDIKKMSVVVFGPRNIKI
ncbi:MAG: insulinase family protein [Patescibacteria group bacterium]|jgi:Zn-dependent M16 (insulinase) family peptidase|nr:insulinase family protein [Patescibacteria group bacterium]